MAIYTRVAPLLLFLFVGQVGLRWYQFTLKLESVYRHLTRWL